MDKRDAYRLAVKRSFQGKGEVRGVWEALFDVLEKTKLLSVGVNRTGNMTMVRLKPPEGRRELSLRTANVSLNGPLVTFVDELTQRSIHDFSTFICNIVPSVGWVGSFGEVAGATFLEEARRRKITLIDDVCEALFQTDAITKQARYQTQEALRTIREQVKRAFQLGATKDDLDTIIAEELVQSVSDS